MRFLFIHQNFPGQFRHIAPALASRGHEVVSLSMNRTPLLPGVHQAIYVPSAPDQRDDSSFGRSLNEWSTKLARGEAVARSLRRLSGAGLKPDVIMAHPGWGEALFVKDVFPRARLLVYAEYFYGVRDADVGFDPEFSDSDDYIGQRLRVKNTHLLHALSDCDAAISPTEFQKSRHPAWAQNRIRVIHDGIDCETFSPNDHAHVRLRRANLNLARSDEVITFVARQLEPYRGYHTFMRALPALQRLRPNAHVIIVGGDGAAYGAPPPKGTTWKQHFLDEVKHQLDMSRIHFVGKVPHSVLTSLMQVSRVHVYLTYPFVLSWSLLEAMSIGCLVVASDTAPVREVIRHGWNGLLTDFFQPAQLAEMVADAVERGEELARVRECARASIKERYDLHQVCLPAQLNWILQQ